MGKEWFDEQPELCDFIATVCVTACVTALLSIGGVSFNRYVHICHNKHYEKVSDVMSVILLLLYISLFVTSIVFHVAWVVNIYRKPKWPPVSHIKIVH